MSLSELSTRLIQTSEMVAHKEPNPEKVGKPTSAAAYGPLEPFRGDTCKTSPVIGVIHARAYTSMAASEKAIPLLRKRIIHEYVYSF